MKNKGAQYARSALHLLTDIELTLPVEHGLQRHSAHPVSQKYRKMLRPAYSSKTNVLAILSCFTVLTRRIRKHKHISLLHPLIILLAVRPYVHSWRLGTQTCVTHCRI